MKPHYKLHLSGRAELLQHGSATPLTPKEAKQRLQANGVTLKAFAERRGLNYRVVSDVVRGVNKGLRGQGYRAAKALGIVIEEGRA